MLSEDKKKRIEALTTEEMVYEINLGHRSRFQREAFAYLKTCYDLKAQKATSDTHPERQPNNEPPNDVKHEYWHQRPIGNIGITVISGVLIILAAFIILHYLGIPLYG